ncbi:MAG: TonB-dependent receptor [Gemmatimonadaceae bacterium]|nr:TonB-dependent receptor [Gemmatimonadaceae bacterium]
MGAALGSAWRLDASVDGFRGDDIPSPGDLYQPFPSRKDAERLGGSLDLRGTLGRATTLVRAYRTDERSGSFNRPDGDRFISFDGRTRTDGAQAQLTLPFGAHRLLIGSDLSRQRATSSRFTAANTRGAPFAPDAEIRSLAAFAEGALSFADDRVSATVGARADRVTLALLSTPFRPDVTGGDSDFTVITPSAGLRATLWPGVALHTSVGQAFVAPDPFGRAGLAVQQGTGGVNVTVGNPALDAERSTTVDVGLRVATTDGAFDGDVTYFATDIRDRNVAARATFTGATRPRLSDGAIVNRVDTRVNAGDATIRGLEVRARYDLLRAAGGAQSLALQITGTRLFRAREASPLVTVDGARFANQTAFTPASVFTAAQLGASSVSDIRNVSDMVAAVGLEYDDRSRWTFGAYGRYVGERLDTDFSDFADISDIRYPRYATVDLMAALQVSARVRLQATVANATDENIYEKRGFNLPGRNVAVRLVTRF